MVVVAVIRGTFKMLRDSRTEEDTGYMIRQTGRVPIGLPGNKDKGVVVEV